MSSDIDFEAFVARLGYVAPKMRHRLETETPGVTLAYELHRPKGAFSDLLIFWHGGGAHGRAGYDRMAEALTATAPVAVCLPDMRGHGESGGERGHAPSPRDVWDDVDRLVARMRRDFPGVRLHLGGHSSGAGLLLNHLTQRPPREAVESSILLAPEFGWRAGLYRDGSTFGSFARVKTWPFLLAAFTGGAVGGGLKAVRFDLGSLAESAGCIAAYSVNMSNAVTPPDPAGQLRRLTLPTRIGIADADELIDADRLAAFVARNRGPATEVWRLAGVDHLGAILDGMPFLRAALGFEPFQGGAA